MILALYADPVQGITMSVIGDESAEAVATYYDEYMNELIALMTVYGNKINEVIVLGEESYVLKILQEVKTEYPNIKVSYAFEDKE